MRVFLLNGKKIQGNSYPLSNKEIKYLSDVLRIKDGESFIAKDEKEKYFTAYIHDGFLTLSEEVEKNDDLPLYSGPSAEIILLQSIAKGKKNELIARFATEAGCAEVVFFPSRYSDVKELGEHSRERIENIMKEAVMQSGGHLPMLFFENSLEDAIRRRKGKSIILHQGIRGKTDYLINAIEKSDEKVTILVGPEGGFSDEECEKAEDNSFIPVILGTNILRTETAGIYAIGGIQTILNHS